MIDLRRAIVALIVVAFAGTAVAQEHPHGGGDRPNRQENRQDNRPDQGVPFPNGNGQTSPGVLSLLPADAVTEHSIDTPSGKLAYTATAGTFALFDQSGDRAAAIF